MPPKRVATVPSERVAEHRECKRSRLSSVSRHKCPTYGNIVRQMRLRETGQLKRRHYASAWTEMGGHFQRLRLRSWSSGASCTTWDMHSAWCAMHRAASLSPSPSSAAAAAAGNWQAHSDPSSTPPRRVAVSNASQPLPVPPPGSLRVTEIVAAGHVVFALTKGGTAAAFSHVTGRRLCVLNSSPDELVRSLFFNKQNASIVTVSHFRTDRFSRLHCRSIPLVRVARGSPHEGFEIFGSERLAWPGFVEFDDTNSKVLTYSASEHRYKVWDMMNYDVLYELNDEGIDELKISPETVLIIGRAKNRQENAEESCCDDSKNLDAPSVCVPDKNSASCGGADSSGGPVAAKTMAIDTPAAPILGLHEPSCTECKLQGGCKHDYVPLTIVGITTGKPLYSLQFAVQSAENVEFIEHFQNKLLVKERGKDMAIVQLKSHDTQRIAGTAQLQPEAFVFLYEKQLFLTFHQWSNGADGTHAQRSKIKVWDFNGGQVAEMEDHHQLHTVFFTHKQDFVISYCKGQDPATIDLTTQDAQGETIGASLNVSHIISGRCVGKIAAHNCPSYDSASEHEGVAKALRRVTALFYDEDVNEIYIGSHAGTLYRWAC